MGGSISAHTVAEIMGCNGNTAHVDAISKRMKCSESNIGFAAFLDKFTILDEIQWPAWAIDLSIKQICDDLASEGIDYSEISFSIDKYVNSNKWDPLYAIQFISELFQKHTFSTGIQIGLLLSIQYHKPRNKQLAYADLIKHPEVQDAVCGLDLIGDEDYFDAEFYVPIFDKWRYYNKIMRAHVGEMPGKSHNIKDAIKKLKVNRIAHGIQATNDILKLAADLNICFDLALHSNLITGAWTNLSSHPIKRMLQHNCIVTINTDDPVQFSCTIDDEFDLALSNGLINEHQASKIMANACAAAHHKVI